MEEGEPRKAVRTESKLVPRRAFRSSTPSEGRGQLAGRSAPQLGTSSHGPAGNAARGPRRAAHPAPGRSNRVRTWRLLPVAALLFGAWPGAAAAQEPTVTLTLSRSELQEDAGNTDITVTATLSATRAGATTVTLSIGGDVRPSDYVVVGSLPSITIPSSTISASETIVLSPVDDDFYEGDETLEVNGSADGVTVIGEDLTLGDTSTRPTLQLPAPDTVTTAYEGQESTEFSLAVRLDGARLEDDLTFEFARDGSSTASTDDYTLTPSLPHAAVIPAGQYSTVVDFAIEATDDTVSENTETLTLIARTTTDSVLSLAPDTIGVDIGDNDFTSGRDPSVTVTFGAPTFGTASPSRDVRVRARGNAITQAVTLTIRPPSAIASWFSPSELILTAAVDRWTSGTFTVTPDAASTADGTYEFTTSTSPETDLNLTDDYVLVYPSSREPAVVRELRLGNVGGPIEDGTVGPDGGWVAFEMSFDRPFVLGSGTLTLGLDSGNVQAPCSHRLNNRRLWCEYAVAAGDYDFDSTINVAAGALQLVWSDGDTNVSWPSPRIPAMGFSADSHLPIVGGDYGVELSVTPASTQEGVGSRNLDIRGVVTGGVALAEPLTVPLVFTNVTASPADYTATGPGSISIARGTIEGSTTATIEALDDFLKEERIETVRIEGGPNIAGIVRSVDFDIIDGPSIELSTSVDSVAEDGGAQMVTVTAALGDPTDQVRPRPIEVTLTLAGTAVEGDDFSLSGDRVITIPANARSGSEELTLTPVDDRLLEGDETIELRGTTPGLAVDETVLTLTDDETEPQVILSVDDDTLLESDGPTTVSVTATLDESVTVDGDIVVTLDTGGTATAGSDGDYTLSWSPSARQITIPQGEDAGSAPVTLTLTPRQDDVAEGDETIVVEGTAAVQNTAMDPLVVQVATIRLNDDDARGVVVDPAQLAIDEGMSREYEVRLSSQPTTTVTVDIDGASGTDLSLDATRLTFTTSNWNTAQTVTVSAAQDDDAVDDTATLTHSASGGGYVSVTRDLPVTVDDDDDPEIELSPTSLTPPEGGNQSYTVALSAEPTAQVTVAITGTSGTDLTLNLSSLTFTTSNWGTAQTVTVTVGQDDDAVDEEATLTHTAAGGDYAGKTEDLVVTVDDDESVGIVLNPTALNPAEGADASYTVALSSEPTAPVTVAITGTTDTDLSLDETSLTFTTANWGTAQSVTVTTGQDEDAADDEVTLTHTATGGDYAGETEDLVVTVDDDESAGIVLNPTALNPAEGADASYTVTLSSEPTSTVTVAITGTTDTDLSLDETSLTFTTANWGTAQSVTVTAGQDDDAVDDEVTLTHTATGGDYAGKTEDLEVTVDDDDTVGIVLNPTALNPPEGADASYTVALASEPTVTVTVAITGTTDTDLSLNTSSLTFTTANWGTAQTVTVTVAQDDDATDETAALTHTAAGGDYAGESEDLVVTVNDDESVGIVLNPTALNPPEGGNQSYSVKLSSQPTDQVTVAITGHGGTDLTLDTTSLTFTTANWGTAQSVTVTAAQDDDAVADTATLTHTAAGGDYAGESEDLVVTVNEDESVGIVLNPTALSPPEGGNQSYSVKLSSQPTDQVTVAITGHGGTDLTLDTTSLTFTTANWGTAQSVTVTAAQDDDAVADTATLTHTAAGGDYAGESEDLVVTVNEDESVGIVLNPTALSPPEGGNQSYSVKLSSQPTDQVTVAITGHGGTDLTLDTTSLTFTTANWGTAQSVTVSAAQDDDAVADTATLTHTAAGGDYAGESEDLVVTVNEDESVGIVLNPTALSPPEGGNQSYSVKLSSQPTDQVTVAITGHGGTDLTLDTTSLTFTTANWGTAQSVTVSAAQDDDAVADTATLTHTAAGGDYAGESEDLVVTVNEDESVGIVLNPTALSPPEGGNQSYSVKLSSQPTDQVTVAITGHGGTDLTLDTTSLTFTTANWGTAQSVTVSAAQDDDAVADTATLTHTAAGGDYAGESEDLVVTVAEDESVGIVLNPTALSPPEGGNQSYSVKLSSQPTAEVTVAITGHSGTDLTLDTTSLTFTTANWGTAQSVTVSAAQDDDAVADTATLTHTAAGGDYAGESEDLVVTVDEDESVGIVLNPTALSPPEGGNQSYSVKLSSQPTDQVTVAITGHGGTDLTLDTTSLTFTTANWGTAQSVTVSAAQDDDAVADTATLTHTAAGGDYAGESEDLVVTVDEDESVGIVLNPTALSPPEGGNQSYSVKLSSQPTDQVTVAITGHGGTDLTLDTTSLTFTTANWGTAQSVTVSAAQDDDAVADTATLTHTAAGGDYAGESEDLVVTVAEDESVGIVLNPTALSPPEGGNQSYSVKLSSQPTDQVTVAITGHGGTDLTLDTTSLTFTTANWGTAQSVTVSAAQDDDAVADTATLTHTAAGGDYAGESEDLVVTVNEDESVGIVLNPTALNPPEGGNQSYTVKLSSQPTAEVTVAITGHSGTDLTLDTTSLTFTTANWGTAQSVTVSAAQDDDAVADTATLTHTAAGGDYAGESEDLVVTVAEDEVVGIVLSPTALNPPEGGNRSYSVKLSSQPTDQVTVAITGHGGTDLTLDTTSLTFTTANWGTAQTVTVTVAQDDDGTDDTETLTHTASGGDYAGKTAELSVTVDDDETVGLVLSDSSLNPAEGGNESYTVKLGSEPTDQVTVAITGHSGTDLTLDTTSLTFTTANWGTAQTVTVTVAQDDDGTDDTETLTHTASGGDYAGKTAELSVTVDDDETVGLVLSDSSLNPAEGGNESYTVKLGSEPTDQVTVAITGHSGTDLTLDTTSLTFTTANWGTAQTVTVTVAQDDDGTDDTETLTHTASGGDYAGKTAELSVTVDDDETVGLVLSDSSLNPAEGGNESYTVKLGSEPTDQVTVAITGHSGTDLTLDTTSLTFTTANWGTAQTVTVTVAQDDDGTDDTATLTHTASGGDYAGKKADVAVTVDDDETVGLVLSDSSLNPAEGGNESYTVTLASEPNAQVTVAITGHSGTDLTLDTTSLTFTTANWGTAQTVTVTVAQDDDGTDDTATLTHTASGGDYAGKKADVAVTVDDDETVGLVLSDSSLNPAEGGNESYTVKLGSEPNAQVTVAITGHSGTDLTLDTTSLTFTTANWGTAQTVTVTVAQDDDGTDDTATLTHTASGGDYAGKKADVAVTVDDDETVGLVLSDSSLNPAEGGNESYTVKLGSEPTDQVTVAITGHSGTDLTLDTTSLTFTTANWGTAQTVTVTVAQDDDGTDDTATLTHTASGGDYAGKKADVAVTVDDDETVGLVLSDSSLNPAEGGNESYTVKLGSEPTDQVTVAITGHSGTDLTLDTTSLTFTTANWGTAQTVTVTVAQDDDGTDDTATLTHTASGGDYAGKKADVAVTVDDDETVGLVLSDSSLNPAEGGNESYTVKLGSEPTDQVTVAITGHSGTDLTLDTTSLTFTTANWGTAQTVTVTVAQDDDGTDDTATLTHTASGGDYAGKKADVAVTVDDDETVGLVLSDSSLNPAEGGNESYTVTLASEPNAQVTVAITGTTDTDLSLDTTSLTFTTANWGTAQTVTVTVAQDDDGTDDTATLTHTASGGDYAGKKADVSVTVDDDETVGLVLSDSSLNPAEGGNESYTVTLASEPNAQVTVAITGTTDTDLSLDTTSLTFTTANWGTAQTVTVTVAQDDDGTDDTATLTHTASGGDYAGKTAELAVTVDDDETVGLVLSDSSLNPAEGGNESYTVTLASEPNAQVTVAITGHGGTDLTLDTTSLTFTTANWGTAQSVTVTAAHDDDATDDTATLTHTASGGDYAGKTAAVSVTVDDDETVGLVLSKSSLNPAEGGNESYTVTLASEPNAQVTVAITGHSGTDLTPDTTSLTFTTSNWGTAQSVTVTATHDDDATDDTATLRHTASGGDYAGETADLPVTVDDDESVGIVLNPTALSPPEGRSASYAVQLSTEPSGTVTVTIAGTAGTDLSLDTSSLTFTTSNWGAAQSVTVTAAQDDDATDDTAMLRHTASGGDYAGETADLPVTVDDDETAATGLTLSVSPTSVPEDGGGMPVTVTGTLDGAPRSVETVVTVAVAGDTADADDFAAVPPFELTIAAAAAGGTATFTLTPVDDALREGPETLSVTGTTPVPNLTVVPAELTITDDDEAPITDNDEANRPPTFGRNRYAFDLPENRSGREEPVVLGTAGASDADGDDLRYTLATGDRDRFTVSPASGTVSYIGAGEDFETGPSEFPLEVTAHGGQHRARAQVLVRVVDAPESPEAENDRAETAEDVPTVIDVLANDRDPDGDELRVASVSAPEHGTATVVSGGVRYEPDLNWHGEDRFSYEAADPGGLTSRATVRVTVTPGNDPPEAVDDEAETLEDVPAVVDVLANDTDVDGDPLRLVSVGPAAHGVAAVTEGGVRYASDLHWHGTDRFIYTIADPEGLTVTATVTMTVLPVNDPPQAVGVIPDQTLEEGGSPVTVDVLPYFTDVDGNPLTYAAVSSDETAVAVSLSGSTLTLSPVVTGTAMVTVTAADGEGLTAVQRFGVAVGDRLVQGVIIDTLAGLARGHLSSARLTVGRLLESGAGGMTRLMVAGQDLSPDAWQRIGAGGLAQSHELLFRAATLRQRRSATNLLGASPDAALRGAGAGGMFGGGFGGAAGGRAQWLQGTDVLLAFGDGDDAAAAPGGAGRWRVWGRGDRQSFQGAPSETSAYEGDLLTGYVGMDVRLTERLLAGVAMGRSGGGGDWQVGASSGELGTELTVLHPYVRWGNHERAVWALVGVGWGRISSVRALTDKRGTSPLNLALGLLEGRQRVAATGGGLEVHLRGEASWARLRTGVGEETIDGLEAGVRRVRSGVEVTRPWQVPRGVTLEPFGAVSTRHDGGDGQTGVGLEVAGGLRLSAGRVRVDAQGRMLALHTATDYEESGISVTATVGNGLYEPGLTASLRPRWGAPGYGAESLWQDHFQSYSEGSGRDDFGVDGRVGYGLRLRGERLLTPFGGYGRSRGARRLQVGANLGLEGLVNGDLASPVQVEFMGERYARPGRADLRVSLYGIISFGARPARTCNPAVTACIGSEARAGREAPQDAARAAADGI